MFWLLPWIVSDIGQTEQSVHPELARFKSELKGWGYQYGPERDPHLAKDHISGICYLIFPYNPRGGPEPKVVVQTDFPLPDRISEEAFESWRAGVDPGSSIDYRVHLDRTIGAHFSVDVAKDRDTTHDALDLRWNELSRLASWLRNPKHQSSRPLIQPLLEDRIVHSIDEYDATFLVHAWNWDYHGGWGGTGIGWAHPAMLQGALIFLTGLDRMPDPQPDHSIWISTTIDVPNDQNLDTLLAKLQPDPRIGSITKYDLHRVIMRKEIEMAQGIQLGIVRKQIETFAWCARSLKDQWQGTIQHSMQMGR